VASWCNCHDAMCLCSLCRLSAQVVWSFTRLVMSDFASDEMRRIASRMFCCLSTQPPARQVLVEQRAIPAMASVIKSVGPSGPAAFLHRCVAMSTRNLSASPATPLKVPCRVIPCWSRRVSCVVVSCRGHRCRCRCRCLGGIGRMTDAVACTARRCCEMESWTC
jgi:hypothetical protein